MIGASSVLLSYRGALEVHVSVRLSSNDRISLIQLAQTSRSTCCSEKTKEPDVTLESEMCGCNLTSDVASNCGGSGGGLQF